MADGEVGRCTGTEQRRVWRTTAGIHPLVAIKVTGLWADAEKTYMQSKEYLDIKQEYNIDKAIEKAGVKDQIAKAQEILNGQKVG